MAKGFKHGAGGVPLNFKVVSYETEEELVAASPKENTVGVVTADTITSWIFSATEPTEPVEGMVWFTTSTTSHAAFNALKKNTLQVYPISAKQYIGGAWVRKTAKIYQNGQWKEAFADLILLDKNGFLSPFSKTGGNGSISTVTTTANSFTVTVRHNSNGAIKYTQGAFDKKYDLTNYNTLEFTVSEATFTSYSGSLGYIGASHDSTSTTYVATKTFNNTGTYTLDISTLKGEYYIVARCTYDYGTGEITVSEVKLTK